MKKSTFILLFMASLFMVSCSGDDDSNDNQQNNQTTEITGMWEATDFKYEGESTTELQGETMTIQYLGQSVSFDDYIVEINPDNTYASSGSYTLELTMNYMGQEISQEHTMTDILGSGTWEIDGNTLLTTDNEFGQTGEATIEILNATTLKLVMPNYTTSIPGGMGNSSTSLSAEITLERM